VGPAGLPSRVESSAPATSALCSPTWGPQATKSQWFGLAGLLADHGYRVLTFDRRGTCPDGELGCSGGQNDGQGWKDLSFLVERLRETGARKVVVGGASLGAMESLSALSRGSTPTG
jgi:pimeloyl-ACP methyl ester carboxylesterase